MNDEPNMSLTQSGQFVQQGLTGNSQKRGIANGAAFSFVPLYDHST
jgi:hypothetical protein